MSSNIVTLTTDFGDYDSYVAEVKAVLLCSKKPPTIVDITHQVPPYGVMIGAFQLLRSYFVFPKGTFHMAVVDPGVGSSRKCLYVKTKDYHFVGPDNGVLLWAVNDAEKRDKKAAEVFEIPVAEKTGVTFHGRDVFATFVADFSPAKAAKLKKVKKMEGRELPSPLKEKETTLGEVLCVDRFGNVVTSVPANGTKKVEVRLGSWRGGIAEVGNYAQIPQGKAALIRGSHGFWEISCRERSAAEFLGLKPGDKVTIYNEV